MNFKRIISVLLTLVIGFNFTSPVLALEKDSDKYESQENQSGYVINGVYYTEEEFERLLENIESFNDNDNSPKRMPRSLTLISAALVGEYAIPLIGTVLVTSYAILVNGEAIKEGTREFNKILDAIKTHKKKKDKERQLEKEEKRKKKEGQKRKKGERTNAKKESAETRKIRSKIPDKLLDKDGNVDLSKFDKRVGKGEKVGYEESVTGKRWVIQKDRGRNSGQGGGHSSEWKLKTHQQFESEADPRTATLSPSGRILRG